MLVQLGAKPDGVIEFDNLYRLAKGNIAELKGLTSPTYAAAHKTHLDCCADLQSAVRARGQIGSGTPT